MRESLLKPGCLLLVLGITLSGCASTRPPAYSDIASSSELRPNSEDKSGRVPYSYSRQVDWRTYTDAVVTPVMIYRGADNQFQRISEQDKELLARYMQEQFSKRLAKRFHLTSAVAANTLRIELTLTGAKASTPVVSTFTRFDLTGTPVNAVQTARGKEGMFTGSVSYAVEIYDASTNKLLRAYVEKQYPSPMNIKATVGGLSAAKVGVRKGADRLVAQLD